MHLQLSARAVATLMHRLCEPKLTPIAQAAAEYEPRLERVFLNSVKEAQAAIPMGELEEILSLGDIGTGGVMFVMKPVFDMLLEQTGKVDVNPYMRAAAAGDTVASVLSSTLVAGAGASEVCVLPLDAEKVGIHVKADFATAEQIDKAWHLKKLGYSNKQIGEMTGIKGISDNYVGYVLGKVKKYKASIEAVITPPQVAAHVVQTTTKAPLPTAGLHPSKIAKWDPKHPSGKSFELFWYEKQTYHGFTVEEIEANLAEYASFSKVGIKQFTADLLAKGKTQSAAYEASKHAAAYSAPAPSAPVKSVYPSQPTGAFARGVNWPIADDVVRTMGTNYENEVIRAYENWKAGLTLTERRAIESYTGSGYSSMNAYLRGHELTASANLQSSIDTLTKTLDKAISLSKPPPPELVWRGIGGGGQEWAGKLASGDVVELKGFTSTTIKPDFAMSWGSSDILLEIKPSGGAYVRTLSNHSSEYEYLLPHGAKYRVVGRKTVKIWSRGSAVEKTVLQLEMF